MFVIAAIVFPVAAGIILGLIKIDYRSLTRYSLFVTVIAAALGVAGLINGGSVTLVNLGENVSLTWTLDNLGRVFMAAVIILYTVVAFYAFEYMKKEERQNIFFAFYYVSLGAMIAVCCAGNLVTLYLCFELATLTTVPLVLHEWSKEAIAAGLKYLFYSIGGALMGLFSVFFVYFYGAAGREFTLGGYLDASKVAGHEGILLAAVFVGIVGFGTKAGLYPMHGWLPSAHPIAPTPASVLLSGIIAKAGVISIIRLVFYSVGADFIRGTWVQYAWMILAMLTILMGSMMAFLEKNMKKRLAFSTISQISYALMALSVLTDDSLRGALLQILSHAASKGCLFMCAGVFLYMLKRRYVKDLTGIGYLMPVTMWCFLIASLSLVGIPPMGGFISKWVISAAIIEDGQGVFAYLPIVVLLISALLTTGYLLTIAMAAFFPGEEYAASEAGQEDKRIGKAEPSPLMYIPMIVLCLMALTVGVFGTDILGALGF